MQGFAFYLTYFLIIVFLVSKLIVAVVVSNLERYHKEQAILKKQKHMKLKSTKAALAGKLTKQIIPIPTKDSKKWTHQIPFEVPVWMN
jgi:Na+-transporting NADH:ubiquinone oxidoreductase subunit NqrC